MSEHAYVVLFISACARELARAAYECVDMQMHMSEKFWRAFTCTRACIHVGRGEHRGAGVPANAIHFHWDVGCVYILECTTEAA